MDLNTPLFDEPRNFIRNQHRIGKDWDEIKSFKTSNCESTAVWLEIKCEEGWPKELTEKDGLWQQLVDSLKDADRRQLEQQEINYIGAESATLAENEDPSFTIPTQEDSAWQQYREHLAREDFPEYVIDSIETECLKTLKCLKLDNTKANTKIKGLVIGHVQSGKTANMTGLMSMAADWGFNMFIVLTGTIESLRKQTQERLLSDLNHGSKCRQQWFCLKNPNKNQNEQRSVDFTFGHQTNVLTVSLKNKARLTALKNWLTEFPGQLATMNVLIIDDESDQAGINTSNNDERTTINKCILDLTNLQSQTLNYVAYTATPYANVLSEAGENTLYPSTFIRSLPLNNSYFGPELIFGIAQPENSEAVEKGTSLDIVRTIPDGDLVHIKEIQTGKNQKTPDTLLDALAWFVCSSAARRAVGARSPTSMLIHTSQLQAHHERIGSVIQTLFSNDSATLKDRCKAIWTRETERFSKKAFKEQYPNYFSDVKDYPNWSEVSFEIDELLRYQLQHIKLSDEGILKYSKAIHLCIDNCANNSPDEDGNLLRLFYPNKEQLDYSAAFIVIGGATLSRGLTIEGLVATYFLRSSKLGDSLMQMGRWFGYRRDYELLPRIWMSENTQEQFAYLASLEAEIREEIKIYESGVKPRDFGPKISSWAPHLLSITAKNKMRGAQTAEFDFSGIRNETTIFSSDSETLASNISTTEEFLKKLANQTLGRLGIQTETPKNRGALFRGIRFETIKEYLLSMKFHHRCRVFAQIEMFTKWFEEVTSGKTDESTYEQWNVIVASLRDVEPWRHDKHEQMSDYWEVAGKALRKVNRSRKITDHEHIKPVSREEAFSIGSLQDPMDKFLDLPEDLMPKKAPLEFEAVKIREKAKMQNIPQLVIYRINGKTNIDNLGENRVNLNLDRDIIGLLIRVPGKRNRSLKKSIQVKIPEGAYPEDAPDIIDELL